MKQAFISLFSLIIAAVSIAFISSSPGFRKIQKRPGIDSTEALKAVETGQRVFMDLFKKRDSVGVANLYTIDAKVMNAGRPAAEGRDDIIKFFGSIFKTGPLMITVKTIGVWTSGDMIVEEGKWIMADKNGKAYDHGKYLILWKMEDGKWKKFRDCHNSDIYPR